MKWVWTGLGVALLASLGGWTYFVGSRHISEADVRKQYENEAVWLDEGKDAEICAAFDDRYVGQVASVSSAGRVLEKTDKASSCAALAAFFVSLKKLNQKAGGGVVTNASTLLQKVVISPDKLTATVTLRSQIKVGTEKTLMMTLTSEGTDTLIKRGGKVLHVRSEGKTSTQ
jgi:hypothetical protein